jgi:hypothetical protein|tara:strand:+ start:1389 stop:1700 length:312 start_codon:yes stop_codon:yes gene_type:complete
MSQKQFLKSRFFKLPNHKRFDFPARYYDERKEQLENKIKEESEKDYSQRIKNSFNSKNNYKSWNNNWETIRLLIIFSILIIGFAFIYTQIDSVLEILTNSQSK